MHPTTYLVGYVIQKVISSQMTKENKIKRNQTQITLVPSYNMENLEKMIDENGMSGQSSNGW